MLIRILDIGSHAVKSAVYRMHSQGPEKVEKDKLPLALGESVFKTGKVSESARERFLHYFKSLPVHYGKDRIDALWVVATSALRDSENGPEIVTAMEKISEKMGLANPGKITILSGREEACLIHLAMLHVAGAEKSEAEFMSLDIGGGSLEIAESREGKWKQALSLPLGAVRFTQSHFEEFPYSLVQIQKGRKHIQSVLEKAEKNGLKLGGKIPEVAWGSSGSIRALGKICGLLRGGPAAKMLSEITPGTLEDCVELSIEKGPQYLQSLFDLDADRSRIILAGILALLETMRALELRRLVPTDSGLRDGVAWHLHAHPDFDLSMMQGEAGSRFREKE